MAIVFRANRVERPVSMANSDDMANTPMANKAGKTYRYRDAEVRRAYQRELMRKRRARVS